MHKYSSKYQGNVIKLLKLKLIVKYARYVNSIIIFVNKLRS